MTSLSWLLYGMSVADSLRNAASAILIGTLVMMVLGFVFLPLIGMLRGDFEIDVGKVAKRLVKPFVTGLALAVLIYIFVPSRQTLLLIAGSEITQKVAAMPEVKIVAGDSLELLKAWIAKETETLKEKPK